MNILTITLPLVIIILVYPNPMVVCISLGFLLFIKKMVQRMRLANAKDMF